MNFVKVTTSGQITIPKEFRNKFATGFFTCELLEDGVFFKPVLIKKTRPQKKKYTLTEFKKWSFKGKHPEEKNLAGKIDQIIYTQ